MSAYDKKQIKIKMSAHYKLSKGSRFEYDVFYGDYKIGKAIQGRNGTVHYNTLVMDDKEYAMNHDGERGRAIEDIEKKVLKLKNEGKIQ